MDINSINNIYSEVFYGTKIKENKNKKNYLFYIFVIFMLIIITLLFSLGVFNLNKTQNEIFSAIDIKTYDTPEYNINYEYYEGKILSAPQIANKCKQSNVAIFTCKGNIVTGTGSGAIIYEDSDNNYTYIVTCAHVIDKEECSIKVKTADEKVFKGEIIGYDENVDLGVIRIKASGLKTIEFGNSEKLVSGCTVYAIGNPGGAQFFASMTKGIVSDFKQPVKTKDGYSFTCIQHDAAVNPGNSGGMLVNEYGQVIGINSQKIAKSEYEGMSFAVPSSIVILAINNIMNSRGLSNLTVSN